jgi:hypothetical protein
MVLYLPYLLAKIILHGFSQNLLTNVLCEHRRHDCGIVGGIIDLECVRGKYPLIAGMLARN